MWASSSFGFTNGAPPLPTGLPTPLSSSPLRDEGSCIFRPGANVHSLTAEFADSFVTSDAFMMFRRVVEASHNAVEEVRAQRGSEKGEQVEHCRAVW